MTELFTNTISVILMTVTQLEFLRGLGGLPEMSITIVKFPNSNSI